MEKKMPEKDPEVVADRPEIAKPAKAIEHKHPELDAEVRALRRELDRIKAILANHAIA